MRRFSGLRLQVAYPGTLGITTDKGQQNNYPLVLDAQTESYETMLLRWQTGVYEVDAPPPTESEGMIQGFPVIVVLTGGIPVTQLNSEGGPSPGPGAPTATVSANGYGLKITLVANGGIPLNLFNLDGTPYNGGFVYDFRTAWEDAKANGQAWNDTNRITYFVDPVNGLETNPGTEALPVKTEAPLTVNSKTVIGYKRGTVSRVTTGPTFAVAGVKRVAYGAASFNTQRPLFLGSTKVTGTWVNTTGNIWSIALAVQPSIVALLPATPVYAESGFTKLWAYATTQTAPAAGQFGYTAGTLYIFSTTNPNTLSVEYTVDTADNRGAFLNAPNLLLQDIAYWFYGDDGAYFTQNSDGSCIRGCDLSGGTADGCGADRSKNTIFEYNIVDGPGFRPRDGTNADGDGFSGHGEGLTGYASGIIRYNTFKRCRKSGVGNQTSASYDVYGNYIYNCRVGIAFFPQAYTGGLPMINRNWNNIIIQLSNDSHSIQHAVGLTVPTQFTFWNNTSLGIGTPVAVAGHRASDNVNETITRRNNITTGFNRGFDCRSATILDLDYDCVFGNTTNYFDNSTGYLTGKTGTHGVASSPLLVKTTDVPNVALQAGSPCAASGTPVGLTEDFARLPINQTNPQIGAMRP